jgi:hypothetical protein
MHIKNETELKPDLWEMMNGCILKLELCKGGKFKYFMFPNKVYSPSHGYQLEVRSPPLYNHPTKNKQKIIEHKNFEEVTLKRFIELLFCVDDHTHPKPAKFYDSDFSTFFEKMYQHIFVYEVLDKALSMSLKVSILNGEVDAYGYDIVLICNNIVRHVQLKGVEKDKLKKQSVHILLGDKPCGCVIVLVWKVIRERVVFEYFYYGSNSKTPLLLKTFRNSKDPKNPKKRKKNKKDIPKKEFRRLNDIFEVISILFDISPTGTP